MGEEVYSRVACFVERGCQVHIDSLRILGYYTANIRLKSHINNLPESRHPRTLLVRKHNYSKFLVY